MRIIKMHIFYEIRRSVGDSASKRWHCEIRQSFVSSKFFFCLRSWPAVSMTL